MVFAFLTFWFDKSEMEIFFTIYLFMAMTVIVKEGFSDPIVTKIGKIDFDDKMKNENHLLTWEFLNVSTKLFTVIWQQIGAMQDECR